MRRTIACQSRFQDPFPLSPRQSQGEDARKRMTYNPRILQRHHVIDIHIARRRPRRPVVRAEPRPRRRRARRVDDHVGAVALKHVLARVAGAANGVPGGEQVARVAGAVARGGGGDAGLRYLKTRERRGGQMRTYGCGHRHGSGAGEGEERREGGEDSDLHGGGLVQRSTIVVWNHPDAVAIVSDIMAMIWVAKGMRCFILMVTPNAHLNIFARKLEILHPNPPPSRPSHPTSPTHPVTHKSHSSKSPLPILPPALPKTPRPLISNVPTPPPFPPDPTPDFRTDQSQREDCPR
jgi:hypothetical protein